MSDDLKVELMNEVGDDGAVYDVARLLRRAGYGTSPKDGARLVRQLLKWGFSVSHPSGTGPKAKIELVRRKIERIRTRYTRKLKTSAATAATLVPGKEYRVLSIHGPWAWAIIHAGKNVENRTWATPYRGEILIHASSQRYTGARLDETRRLIARCSKRPLAQIPTVFPARTMVGLVDLVECTDLDVRSPWAGDDIKWILENPRYLTNPPVDVDGKLNLWSSLHSTDSSPSSTS